MPRSIQRSKHIDPIDGETDPDEIYIDDFDFFHKARRREPRASREELAVYLFREAVFSTIGHPPSPAELVDAFARLAFAASGPTEIVKYFGERVRRLHELADQFSGGAR